MYSCESSDTMSGELADLRVVNPKLVTPGGTVFGGVAASGRKIVDVEATPELPDAETEVDAEGNYLVL